MKDRVRLAILNVQPYIPGKPIEEVKRELGLKDVIKLASNENPYGPSPKVLKAIHAAAKTINRYPDGDCFYLRQALVSKLKVQSDQIIFGNGSDEVIVFATKSLLNEDDEVIIAKPSFLIYDIASKLAGAVVKEIPLINYQYDLEGMIRAITPKTKIIFVGNPDNPGGHFIAQKTLIKFLKDVPSNILVMIDEAYFEYVTDKAYGDSIELLNNFSNIIICRTFSKMYGLAGLRVGYGVSHPDIINLLNRVREPFNVNSIAQAAALACLEDDVYYKDIALKVDQERTYLYNEFKRLGLDFVQSATNFILVQITQGESTSWVKEIMKKGVIVRDMSHWGLKNFIRVTIGTHQENKRLIKVLEEIL